MTRQHILAALADCDARGDTEFLQLYGFEPSRGYALVYEGRSYDSQAILGVAHRFATGRLATSEEFHDGVQGAAAVLRRRGFEVPEPASATRATRPRAPRAARSPVSRPVAARETPAAICPTCSMTLPATGRCDDCG